MAIPILRTSSSWGPLFMRLALGGVMAVHGAQKVLGVFGGPGLGGWVGFMGKMGYPPVYGYALALGEFFGGLALIVGLLTRLAAIGFVAEMSAVIKVVHFKNGFFMNWGSAAGKGEGYEYHLLAVGLALGLLALGGGALSLDHRLQKKGAK